MTTDNPIALLRNEHTALLGQLHLLEQGEETGQKIPTLLRTIIRDSTVHFKREALLFKALMSKLGKGGQSLQPLVEEHHFLKRQARELLKSLLPLNGQRKTSCPENLVPQVGDFIKQFKAHIHHEETVVFVLARSRLTTAQRRNVAIKMLGV